MIDVFISYAREDMKPARVLANALEQQGWTVWWDRSLLAGDDYEKVIRENLETASCVIVLWSRQSVESEWVADEARLAKHRGVLVPVLIDGSLGDIDIPLGFGSVHTERLIGWKGKGNDPAFQRLTEAVKRTGARPTGAQRMPPAAARPKRKAMLASVGVASVSIIVAVAWALTRTGASESVNVPPAYARDADTTIRPDTTPPSSQIPDGQIAERNPARPVRGTGRVSLGTNFAAFLSVNGTIRRDDTIRTFPQYFSFNAGQRLTLDLIPLVNLDDDPRNDCVAAWGPKQVTVEPGDTIQFERWTACRR